MSYIALYRAFRPKNFSEVVGQEHVSKTLKNALVNFRVAHAYLFCGPRGTGKTSSAKILAKAVNCLDFKQGEPCNQCENCTAINSGNFLDVFEIDAASNRGIDEIRDIRDKVKFAPSQGKTKVYIIDEVHMLTSEAFNALLKTLEEPPEHVLFILATTEPQKIPLTILSRCQRFDFRKISTAEIKEHLAAILEKENIAISDNALNVIARKAAGGMRDAISVLDQCIAFAGEKIESEHVEKVLGTLGEEQVLQISQDIITGNAGLVILQINKYLQSGKDVKQIVRDLIEHFRQVMLFKLSQSEGLVTISKEILPQVEEQSQKLSVAYLGQIILKLTEVERELRFSSQPQILLEAGLVEIIITGNSTGFTDNQTENIATTPTAGMSKAKKKKEANTKSPQLENSRDGNNIVLDIQEIKRLWPEVLDKVKQEKITTHAFLVAAEPLEIADEKLVLNFKSSYKFHRDKISQQENKDLVEKVLKELINKDVKINCILEGAKASDNNSSQGNRAVEQAIELFGGNIVEIKD